MIHHEANASKWHTTSHIYLLSMIHMGCMLCFGHAGVIISLVCISLVFYIGTTYHKVHACFEVYGFLGT